MASSRAGLAPPSSRSPSQEYSSLEQGSGPHRSAPSPSKLQHTSTASTDWQDTTALEPAGVARVRHTRVRKPSSCTGCSKKKLRCNRARHCNQCSARGELCIWEGGAVPLFDSRAENDAQELREKVARLEELVQHLTSRPDLQSPRANLPSPPNTDGTTSDHPSPATDYELPSPKIKYTSDADHYSMDLRSNDLVEALSQLAIREFVLTEGSGAEAMAPGGGNGENFVAEARSFLETIPQRFGLSFEMPNNGLPEKSFEISTLSPGVLGAGAVPTPMKDVLKFLPNHAQALSAYRYFSGYVSWYSHPVHLSSFEAQWAELNRALQMEETERDAAIDPFFVSTFLAVLAMGLSMMPPARAARDGFPVDKGKLVNFWLEGAMAGLSCGRFLDNPSVEALRAVVVISTYFVFMAPGEASGSGLGLLGLSVQVAMSLGLHRDPNHTPGKYTFFEAEERRRLFWSLFSLCILSSAALGRTWAVFQLDNIDCEFPLDATDAEILDENLARAGIAARKRRNEETPMTFLIWKMKCAVQAKHLNDRAFGIKPTSYATVLELDKQLRDFEDTIPARYVLRLDSLGSIIRPVSAISVTEMRACMLQIALGGEFVRLHRPWLVLASTTPAYQYSREQAIKYARLILAIYRSPSCCSQTWGGLNYKASNAAILIAVEILTFPNSPDVDALRKSVSAALLQLESHVAVSNICRKSAGVIRFLLQKDAYLFSQQDPRAVKRFRTSALPPPPSHLRAAFAPPPNPQTYGNSYLPDPYQQDPLPHKYNYFYQQPIDPPPPQVEQAIQPRPFVRRQSTLTSHIPDGPPYPTDAYAQPPPQNSIFGGDHSFDFQLPPDNSKYAFKASPEYPAFDQIFTSPNSYAPVSSPSAVLSHSNFPLDSYDDGTYPQPPLNNSYSLNQY